MEVRGRGAPSPGYEIREARVTRAGGRVDPGVARDFPRSGRAPRWSAASPGAWPSCCGRRDGRRAARRRQHRGGAAGPAGRQDAAGRRRARAGGRARLLGLDTPAGSTCPTPASPTATPAARCSARGRSRPRWCRDSTARGRASASVFERRKVARLARDGPAAPLPLHARQRARLRDALRDGSRPPARSWPPTPDAAAALHGRVLGAPAQDRSRCSASPPTSALRKRIQATLGGERRVRAALRPDLRPAQAARVTSATQSTMGPRSGRYTTGRDAAAANG